MFSYLVNYPKSTFSKFIRIRKIVCCSSNGAKVVLQGFHTLDSFHSFKLIGNKLYTIKQFKYFLKDFTTFILLKVCYLKEKIILETSMFSEIAVSTLSLFDIGKHHSDKWITS